MPEPRGEAPAVNHAEELPDHLLTKLREADITDDEISKLIEAETYDESDGICLEITDPETGRNIFGRGYVWLKAIKWSKGKKCWILHLYPLRQRPRRMDDANFEHLNIRRTQSRREDD